MSPEGLQALAERAHIGFADFDHDGDLDIFAQMVPFRQTSIMTPLSEPDLETHGWVFS